VAQVLVDDAGPHVRDLGTLGKPVDDERVQVLIVRHGHVQQEVLAAGDDEHADGVGQPGRPVPEGLDVPPGRRPDPDGDQRLDRTADRGQVDVEQGPADDPALAQRPGPVQRGGRRDADRGGQVAVGPPCIALQFTQEGRI
jgi:hypothetical protein